MINKLEVLNPYLGQEMQNLNKKIAIPVETFKPDYYRVVVELEAYNKKIFSRDYPGIKFLQMQYLEEKCKRKKKIWKKYIAHVKIN